MSSLHERAFRKNRWGQFVGRTAKARRYGLIGLVALLATGGTGLFLMTSGNPLPGQILIGASVLAIVIYNGFRATRSD